MREGHADATMASRPVIYHGAAITDARSDRLRLDVHVIVERGIVAAIEDSRTEYSPRGPGSCFTRPRPDGRVAYRETAGCLTVQPERFQIRIVLS